MYVPASGEEMAEAKVVNPQVWRQITDAYVERAREDRSDLSTMLIDIDATKAANDELGHHMGDRLIDMVDQLNRMVVDAVRTENNPKYPKRELDLVTSKSPKLQELDLIIPGVELSEPQAERIGGDEFGITLPNTGREGANILAERIRSSFAERLKLPENWALARVGAGISVGVATLEPGMTSSDLLRQADRMMYIDKLRQLRPLTPEEEEDFLSAVEHLERAGVRPRDVPKYIQLLGSSAINHAIDAKEREDAGQLVLVEDLESESSSEAA